MTMRAVSRLDGKYLRGCLVMLPLALVVAIAVVLAITRFMPIK